MDTIFDEDFIESIPRHEPIKKLKMPHAKHGEFKILRDYDPKIARNTNYALCVDPAYRLKGDFAGIVLFNLEEMDIEATAKLKLGKINNLPDVVKFIVSMYPNSIIIIEKNNFGQAVLERLQEDYTISGKLYYSYGNKDPKKMSDTQRIDNKIYGIQTDKSTRPKMIDCLIKYVLQYPEKLKSADIINELIYLQEKKNGRIEAASGQHDDMIMSLSFILYLLEYKPNELNKFKRLSTSDISNLNSLYINDSLSTQTINTKMLIKSGYDINAVHKDVDSFNLDEFKGSGLDVSAFISTIVNFNK